MDQTRGDPKSQLHIAARNSFEHFRDARKLFRLFKSLNELNSIRDILFKAQGTADDVEAILSSLTRPRRPRRLPPLLALRQPLHPQQAEDH